MSDAISPESRRIRIAATSIFVATCAIATSHVLTAFALGERGVVLTLASESFDGVYLVVLMASAAVGVLSIWRPRWSTIGLLTGLLLCQFLAARSIALDPASGEFSRYVAGVLTKRDLLTRLNDGRHCVESSALYITLRTDDATEVNATFFRGIWPLAFSTQRILNKFELPRCTSGPG